MKRSLLQIIAILLIASGTCFGSNFYYPVVSPEYSFLYDYIDRGLILNHDGDHLSEAVGLYSFKTGRDNLPEIGLGGGAFEQFKIRSYAFLTESYRTGKFSRAASYESIRGALAAQPSDKLWLYINFLLDEELDDNPDYRGKKWRGFAGEVENAFVLYRAGRFTLQAGRFGGFWGPSRESLVLSESSRPMDAIAVRYHWGFLHYTFQTGKLDRVRQPDENETVFENRYFSGHMLDLKLHRNFYLGLFESVIYGGPGRPLEFAYLNPFLFFHAFQLNEGYNDNTYLGIDAAWYYKKNNKFYAQLFIDDFQIDSEVRGDNEPNEIGFLIGWHAAELYEHYEIKAEYLAITNRTYNQVYERNRYLNRGALIGNDYGPDGDRARVTVSRWLDNLKRLSLTLEYRRKGEGRFDDQWTRPWMDVDNYSEPFPTGTVEKTFQPSLRMTGIFKKYIYLDIDAGVRFTGNYLHQSGRDETIPYFNFRLTLMLYSLFDLKTPGS